MWIFKMTKCGFRNLTEVGIQSPTSDSTTNFTHDEDRVTRLRRGLCNRLDRDKDITTSIDPHLLQIP